MRYKNVTVNQMFTQKKWTFKLVKQSIDMRNDIFNIKSHMIIIIDTNAKRVTHAISSDAVVLCVVRGM